MKKEVSYKKELKQRLAKAIEAEEKAYKATLANPTAENISLLNNRRADVAIIESRIENLGRPGTYMEEYYFPDL